MNNYTKFIVLTRFKATSFETKEEAMDRARSLEEIGYQVKVFCKSKTLKEDILKLLHQTQTFEQKTHFFGGAL